MEIPSYSGYRGPTERGTGLKAIIHSRTDLGDRIQEILGDSATRHLADTLAEAAWEEAQKAGYRPGDDWGPFLTAVDWRARAADRIASDIQSKARRSRD